MWLEINHITLFIVLIYMCKLIRYLYFLEFHILQNKFESIPPDVRKKLNKRFNFFFQLVFR